MAEFEKEIHEESSLTLKERIEEFLESLSLKWQEFLDWSDDKGLPLRKVNDFFESKGIPALPALLLILLLLVAGIYVAFLMASAPPVNIFSISVKDTEGNSLQGASVQLQFTAQDGTSQTKTEVTDIDGKAVFENIPVSKATVAVNAEDYQAYSHQVQVEEGRDKKLVTVNLMRNDNPNVMVSVTVVGPLSSDIVLLNNLNEVVEVQNASLYAQFEIEPSQNYTIIGKAVGYRDELKVVQVGTSNLPLILKMFKEGEERTAPIYVRVYNQDGFTPISNATVKVLDEVTGALLASAQSGVDGATVGLEVTLGRNVSLSVSRDGFLTWILPFVAVSEPEVSVISRLNERTPENSKNIVITVIDEDGKVIQSPHIALYCGEINEEKDPLGGIAGFDVEIGVACLVAVSKEGFLPVQKELTSAVEQSIIIRRASSANSGTLEVETIDQDASTVAGVDIALFLNGQPLGIIEKSGIDGVAKFEHLPLGQVTLKGAASGLEGELAVEVESIETTGINGKRVQFLLSAAKGSVFVTVIDHFARTPIANAVVEVKSSTVENSTKCTAVNGSCVLKVEKGKVTTRVTALGFEPLESEFEVLPGENTQVFELISTEISGDTSLVFVGVFNEKNKRVLVLNPASRYTAKYIMKAPPLIEFTSAKAFIQVGESDVDVESGAGAIVSYSSPGARMNGGIDYSLIDSFESTVTGGSLNLVNEDLREVIPTEQLPNGDLTPLPTTQGTTASLSAEKLKWVEFSFDKFTGTKELKVVIETNAIEQGNIELFHRTEYQVTANGESETLRSPIDEQAGVDKSPLIARLAEPNVIPIEFEGKCVESMCVELWFEGSSGKQSAFEGFEAVIPETFKLNYRILTPPPALLQGTRSTVTLSLQSDSEAIEISGNQSVVTRQVSTQQNGDGFFALKAAQFSNDVPLLFSATGAASFEEELHVRVVNTGNQLRVTTEPLQLIAFEENTLKMRVVDKYGAVVSNARVTLQKGAALQSEVELREENAGVYVAELSPLSFGEIPYKVQAESFPTASGRINVIAKSIISIEPETGLAVVVDSFEETEGSTFTITNLIPDKEVRVSLTVLPDRVTKYSEVAVNEPSFKLKGGETRTVVLTGKLKNSVISFGAQANTFKEDFRGKIEVNARVVGFAQRESVSFSASAIVQQQLLSQLLDYSTDSLEFAVELPFQRKDFQDVSVTNNAPKPILLNQHSNLPGVFVSPVSAVIAQGATIEFNVTGSPSPFMGDQCVFEDLSESGFIEFIASYQGITSKKEIKVDVQATSSARCLVPGGVNVVLPMDVNFMFPPGTIASRTPAFDGSQAVKLPTLELIVFSQNTQVTDQRAYLPAGSPLEIGSQHVAMDASGFQVRFPFHAVIAVPPQAQQATLPDGSIKLSTLAAEIILPPGLQQGLQGVTQFASPSDPYGGFGSLNSYQRFGSFFGTRSSYALPAGTPIRITSVSATTGEAFTVKYEHEVYVDFPPDSQVQQSGSSVNAMLPNCAQLEVYSRIGELKNFRDVLPSGRQVTISNARLTGKTAKIAKGGKIAVTTCLGAEEDEKLFQTKLLAAVTFVLPPGTPNPKKTNFEVNYPNCAELVYKSGYSLGVSSAKKIVFPLSAKVKDELENGAREVEVNSGETVSLSPCKSITPSVSTFAGLGLQARTSNNKQLEFTFTEADIRKTVKATQTICLINQRNGVVSPVGSSFISIVTGVKDFNLQLKPVKVHTQSELSPSKENECNNVFEISAEISPGVHDHVCITKPGEYTGEIKFSGRDSTGWTGSSKIPIKIKVEHGKDCKRDHEKAASELLSTFSIDYSSDNKNERTGKSFIFAFKGVGKNHQRVLTLLNNYESSVSLRTEGSNALSCSFPASMSMSTGGAVAVTCYPTRITQGIEQLKVIATSGNKEFERKVNVQVFQSNPAVYQNSSWGELAPFAESEKSKATLYSYEFISLASDEASGQTRRITSDENGGFGGVCSKHYCSYSQAEFAFNDFLSQIAIIANEKVADQGVHKRFCQPGANPGGYIKTVVIHLANTAQDFANYVNLPRSLSIPYDVVGVPSLKGCGVYKISAKLDLCSGTAQGATTPSERLQNSKLQIAGAEKIAGCPRNLANAPLFLAGKQDELNVFLGRELGFNFQKPQFLGIGGVLSFGPYAAGKNKGDVFTVKNLYGTIYGETAPLPKAKQPVKYENAGFCAKRAGEQMLAITGGSAAIGTTLLLTGYGAAFGGRLIYGATEALIGCGIIAGAEAATQALPGEQDVFCATMNGCVRSSVFGAISTLLPGGASAASKLSGAGAGIAGIKTAAATALPGSIGSAATYAGIATGAAVGASALSSYSGDSPAFPPGTAGPMAYAGAKTIGQSITPSAEIFEQQFTAVRSNPHLARFFPDNRGGRKILEQVLSAEKTKPGLGAFEAKSIQRMAANPNIAFAKAHQTILQQEVNALLANTHAMKASAIINDLRVTVKDESMLADVYQDVLKARGNDNKLVAAARSSLEKAIQGKSDVALGQSVYSDTFKQQLAASGAPDHRGAFLQTAEAQAKTGVKGVAQIDKWAKGKAAVRKLGPAVVQVAAQLLLDIDLRPNEVRVPSSAKNVLIVYHVEDPLTATTLPSIHQVCLQGANGECSDKFYLANACDSDKDACMLTFDLPGRGEDSYSLFVSFNNQQIPQRELFDSIMFPEAPPMELQGNFKFSTLTQADLTPLREDDSDNGDEKALKSPSSLKVNQDEVIEE